MAAANLSGRNILVAEDEFLIADDLCDQLAAAGAVVVGPASSVGMALDLARDRRIDGAVLDVSLNGELIYPVADLLMAANTPFAFVTGYDDQAIPPRFAGVPRRHKPASLRTIADLLC